jgi:O-antigen ligase
VNERIASVLVAAFLFLCIILGGSGQGVWTNLALQLLGLALIAAAAIAAKPADARRSGTFVYVLIGLGLLVVLVQLIPMPAGMWTTLPGRESLEAGLALAGEPGIALPLSEAPYRTVMALFAFIPGLAMFIAVVRLRPRQGWLAVAIAAGMTLSIGLGAIQVASGSRSWAHFYPITSPGAVGVFANVNHMGTLLLVTIPFAAALFASSKGDSAARVQGRWIVAIATLLLVVVGIALNGSFAALGLALPVLVASASIVPTAMRWRGIALLVSGVALAGAVVVLATTPITITPSATSETSISSRQEIWTTTAAAIGDSFPAGTGLGSFEQVYRQYEDPMDVGRSYVNHAHNDYLELVLELGAPGLVLIVLFLSWWAVIAARIWTSPLSTPFERAATIASAAILAHSVVDYPLRTAAIAAIFGMAIAIMAQPVRRSEPAAAGERRPARHVKLG